MIEHGLETKVERVLIGQYVCEVCFDKILINIK